MADRFWSIYTGQDKVAVAETGTTTAAADVELRITYTATALVGNKSAAIMAVRQILSRLVEETWPPA